MTDQEGLIGLLRDCTPLQPIRLALPPTQRKQLPVTTQVGDREVQGLDPELDWQDSPTGEKWDRIRSAFMNGKTAAEVVAEATNLSVPAWLDICVKMAPKNVTVQGEVNFKHMIDNLAPINKEEYKFKANPIQVEYSEVE